MGSPPSRAGHHLFSGSGSERGAEYRLTGAKTAVGSSLTAATELIDPNSAARVRNASISAFGALIGREAELKSALGLLAPTGARLLTIVGPAGVGKTRFALELAKAASPRFADGAWFVDLSDLSDAARIPEVVARALGLRDAQRPASRLLEYYLAPREILLVLDNLEHLSGAAAIVVELLLSSTGLRIIATSREALRLHGEQRFPLAPLMCPAESTGVIVADLAASSAARLFLSHARRSAPDFTFSEDNAVAIAQLCARLDGLPLALELVAARADIFSPEVMLERLERGEPLASANATDGPARHRSLEAALGWSYALLDEADRALLRRLAVFEGGLSVAAAARVVDADDLGIDTFERLVALTDRSLLRPVGSQREPRFALLRTTHAFAHAALQASGELRKVAARHAQFFLELAETAEPELRGPNQAVWLEKLDSDSDNFRAALRWAEQSSDVPELGMQLSAALWRFWDARGYRTEGRRWLESQLVKCVTAKPSDTIQPTVATTRALLAAGALALSAGDLNAAAEYLESARAESRFAGDPWGDAEALSFLGTVAYVRFEREPAMRLFEEALLAKRALGDAHGTADLLVSLGMVLRDQGKLTQAQGSVEQGLRIHRAAGNLAGIASSLLRLGSVMIDRERLEEAQVLFEESLALFEELGQDQGAAAALIGAGEIAQQRGDLAAAALAWSASLERLYKIGQPYGLSWCLEALGEVALLCGEASSALQFLESSAGLCETVGIPADPGRISTREQHHAALDVLLGAAETNAARAAARQRPLGEVIREAVEFAIALSARRAAESDVTRQPTAAALKTNESRSAESGTAEAIQSELSQRESEVLALVAQGLSNKRIARALGVSDNTVKFHLTSVYNKLGCHSRAQAASIAAVRGMLPMSNPVKTQRLEPTQSLSARAEPKTPA